MIITRTVNSQSMCLNCGQKTSLATDKGHGRKPKPGDISICTYCGHIMIFDDELKNRESTDNEIFDIAGNRDIVRVQTIRKTCHDVATEMADSIFRKEIPKDDKDRFIRIITKSTFMHVLEMIGNDEMDPENLKNLAQMVSSQVLRNLYNKPDELK
jgi:hypothetical protein